MAGQNDLNYFDGMDEGFTSGLAQFGIDENVYGGFSDGEKTALSNDYLDGGFSANGSSDFGMGDLGSALGSGWDMLKGGLDTVSGLAGLYMDWDKLQSTKASARDAHNASATQYKNYLARARSTSASMGLPSSVGAGNARQDVAKSTV